MRSKQRSFKGWRYYLEFWKIYHLVKTKVRNTYRRIETTCVGTVTNNVKLLRPDDGGECDDDDYEYDNDDDDDCGN